MNAARLTLTPCRLVYFLIANREGYSIKCSALRESILGAELSLFSGGHAFSSLSCQLLPWIVSGRDLTVRLS